MESKSTVYSSFKLYYIISPKSSSENPLPPISGFCAHTCDFRLVPKKVYLHEWFLVAFLKQLLRCSINGRGCRLIELMWYLVPLHIISCCYFNYYTYTKNFRVSCQKTLPSKMLVLKTNIIWIYSILWKNIRTAYRNCKVIYVFMSCKLSLLHTLMEFDLNDYVTYAP